MTSRNFKKVGFFPQTLKLTNNITNFTPDLFFPTNEKNHVILIDGRTILDGVIQEKLSSKIEKLESLKIVVEKLRKKTRIIILFVGIFSFVGKN